MAAGMPLANSENTMKRVICYSGGHASAITAVEVSRQFGTSEMVLLNHDINPTKEHADIKRFKTEVASYLGLPVTYANCLGIEKPENIPDQFQVCMIAKAFKVENGMELCTNRLKTAPFHNWLGANCTPGEAVVYYGFDSGEGRRIERRRKYLSVMGYESGFLAELTRSIESTEEVGITPPLTYEIFEHGNCIGCLKAGLRHWYIVFCYYPHIWKQGKEAEAYIGHSIHADGFLDSFESRFESMQLAGVTPTEKGSAQKFWADVRRVSGEGWISPNLFPPEVPCECLIN